MILISALAMIETPGKEKDLEHKIILSKNQAH